MNPRVIYAVPERRMAARAMYKSHSDTFNKLVSFFSSNKLDIRKYLRFMATDIRLHNDEIDEKLMSKWGLNLFAERLASEENNAKIYRWYSKSIKTIAETCLGSECASTADFLRKLIREKKLAPWVVAGRISAYYLAAIPDFPKVVSRLDQISRDELAFISSRYDMYNTEVNKAVLAFERRKANPIRATDEMIEKMRPEWNKIHVKNELFDPSLD